MGGTPIEIRNIYKYNKHKLIRYYALSASLHVTGYPVLDGEDLQNIFPPLDAQTLQPGKSSLNIVISPHLRKQPLPF